MNRATFLRIERKRRAQRPAQPWQRQKIERLAQEAGIELPVVQWYCEARNAIRRLKAYIAQPMLDGFSEACG